MPDLLVRVPYVFAATIRRPRKRNDDTVGYLGHLDLTVEVVSPEDVPVVLHGVEGAFMPLPVHRFHDGRLWVPKVEGRKADSVVRKADWLRGDPDLGFSNHPLFRKSSGYHEVAMGPAVPKGSDTLVKEFKSDDEQEVVAAIREAARDHLVVGEEVWTRTPEPVFGVSRHIMSSDHVSIVDFNGGRDQYRLDQGQWLAELDRSNSARASALHCMGEVVVLRPDLLRARTTEHSVAWTADHVLKELYEQMAGGSVEDFAKYVRLREATRDLHRSLAHDGPVDLPVLASVIGEATDVLERLERQARNFGIGHTREYVDNSVGRIERELAAPEREDVAGFIP